MAHVKFLPYESLSRDGRTYHTTKNKGRHISRKTGCRFNATDRPRCFIHWIYIIIYVLLTTVLAVQLIRVAILVLALSRLPLTQFTCKQGWDLLIELSDFDAVQAKCRLVNCVYSWTIHVYEDPSSELSSLWYAGQQPNSTSKLFREHDADTTCNIVKGNRSIACRLRCANFEMYIYFCFIARVLKVRPLLWLR